VTGHVNGNARYWPREQLVWRAPPSHDILIASREGSDMRNPADLDHLHVPADPRRVDDRRWPELGREGRQLLRRATSAMWNGARPDLRESHRVFIGGRRPAEEPSEAIATCQFLVRRGGWVELVDHRASSGKVLGFDNQRCVPVDLVRLELQK